MGGEAGGFDGNQSINEDLTSGSSPEGDVRDVGSRDKADLVRVKLSGVYLPLVVWPFNVGNSANTLASR